MLVFLFGFANSVLRGPLKLVAKLAMTQSKIILVLANSVKHAPSSCVAGREIISVGSEYEVGGWIRPITKHGEGELYPSETNLGSHRQPETFDFVQIHFEEHAGNFLQPENWFIQPNKPWKCVNKLFTKPGLELLKQNPSDLWLQPNQKSDRVRSSHLEQLDNLSSLFLIHVPKVRVRFFWRIWEGEFRRARRIEFSYRNHSYDLGVTDPILAEKYKDRFPAQCDSPVDFDLKPAGGCYLCISLAQEFRGYHFKVVATVIESKVGAS